MARSTELLGTNHIPSVFGGTQRCVRERRCRTRCPHDKVKGLVLLDTLEMTMGEAVDRSCRVLKEAV